MHFFSPKARPIGTVIRDLREFRGLTQGELAEAPDVDLDAGNLSRFERGLQSIALPKLEAIAKHLGVKMSEIYLQAESGASFKYSSPDDRSNTGIQIGEHNSAANDYVYVTRVRGPKLSAGNGLIAWEHEEIERSHAFRRDWMQKRGFSPDKCKLWEVDGESMAPTLHHGDFVMINTAEREVVSGEIYALAAEDGLRVKRLHKRVTGIWMLSDNPDQLRYPQEALTDQNATVIGRVRWRGGEI